MGRENSEALAILERALLPIKSAETLFFEGRKLHTNDLIREGYRQLNLPAPVTQQRYYSWNSAGTDYVRVESTIVVSETVLTTVFIKNHHGIWEVLPECVADVSTIFKRDQLLGTFPFFRFFATFDYPYELSVVNEVQGSPQELIVQGHLSGKPIECEADISADFAYTVGTTDRQLRLLREKTFGGRSVHLVLDTVKMNPSMDRRVFDLPARRKVIMSSMDEYLSVRNTQWPTVRR